MKVMHWNKKRLKQSKLYLILDREVQSYDELFKVMKQAVQAGVDIVQLRDKKGSARDMIDFSQKAMSVLKGQAAFIINDRVDIALLVKADGVHLGQNDIEIEEARALVGQKMMIGVSCQTLAMAKKAEKAGADYLGFGSVFKTKTKPERLPMNQAVLKRVLSQINIPVFPIGGITLENIEQVLACRAKGVAVCRDVALAKNVCKVVKEYKEILL